jgi:hypothetical protein
MEMRFLASAKKGPNTSDRSDIVDEILVLE